jgi:ABC-type Fe3+/spermidine/putrescine transport system ATPase subunit
MHRGRLEQVGEPEGLYRRPRTRFVAEFLGAVNWIDGAGVRPEALRLSPAEPAGGAPRRKVRVTGSVYLGNCLHVRVRLESGEEAVVEAPANGAPPAAGEAWIWWDPADEMRL